MTEKVKKLKVELRKALIEAYGYETTSVTLTLNGYGFYTQTSERTAESLKNEGISMRNINREWIKQMSKENKNSDKQQNGNDLIADVTKSYYLTKDRQGNYQILNELAYEKKLIYG